MIFLVLHFFNFANFLRNLVCFRPNESVAEICARYFRISQFTRWQMMITFSVTSHRKTFFHSLKINGRNVEKKKSSVTGSKVGH